MTKEEKVTKVAKVAKEAKVAKVAKEEETTSPGTPYCGGYTRPKRTVIQVVSSNRTCDLSVLCLQALNMSIVHVVVFIISWTPYTVMGTW